jgi:hypothetical protein
MYSFWQFSVILFFSRSSQTSIHSIHWPIHPLIHILLSNGTMAQCRQLRKPYCCSRSCNGCFCSHYDYSSRQFLSLYTLCSSILHFILHKCWSVTILQHFQHFTCILHTLLHIFLHTFPLYCSPPRCLEKCFGSSG